MTLTPKRRQQMIVEVATADAEHTEATLREADDEGWLIWQLAPPRYRLRFYQRATYPEDIPLVLTSGYLELWKAGVIPALRALTEWEKAKAPGVDPATGQPVPAQEITDTTPYFWAILTTLPPFLFTKYQNEYIRLVKAEQAKILEQVQ